MISAGLNVFFIGFVGDTAVFDDISVELTRVIDRSGLCLIIDSDKSEARRLTLTPLEVIHKAPMIVSLDRVLGLGNELKLIINKERTEAVVIITGAVFGNVDGGVVLTVESFCKLDKSLVVYLPAEVVDVTSLSYSVGKSGDGAAGVVVDADKVVVSARCYSLALHYGEGAFARHHSLGDSSLEKPFGSTGAKLMPRIVLILGLKHA